MLLSADEIDYNQETGYAEARGNVVFQRFESNEEIRADKAEYNVNEETGKFYNIRGSGPQHVNARPGVLTSTSPFYFQGEWAERLGEKYVLHNGWLTNCKLPNPWWTLRGPRFDIVPGEHAIAYRSIFRLKKLPLFYTPFFYKSLEKVPRHSGFLLPNIGNSSRRGKMIGVGYYWSINRSYDATYRIQEFTQRGLAHHVELRGKPRAGSDFDAIFFGVNDRGLELPNGARRKEGGYNLSMSGVSDLGHGFVARGTLNYLSSLQFRQAFTESFNEAIFSEVHSVGFVARHWSSYSFNTVFARLENFQTIRPEDSIVIRKLPSLEFSSRDRQVSKKILPIWVSLESTAGLFRRTQPLFQTQAFTSRVSFEPRVMTALRWKGFHMLPSFSFHDVNYGEEAQRGRVIQHRLNRSAREFSVDLIAPALQRTFERKTWLGEKLKHVIEPRASFRHVSGAADFNRVIRFDETDLLSNTTEAEVSVINRLYAKRGSTVSEIFSWQLWQRRYFNPDFGGAVEPGRRNVVLSAAQLTPYAFLDAPRNYSPVISVLRASPKPGFGLEWRSDYDPARGQVVNSGLTADYRLARYFISAGHNQVRSNPLVLTPAANQFRGVVGFGDPNHRGWNAAFTAIYDYRVGIMQFATTQVTYNTDCCGFSVQFRRFSFGTRNENQFRVAFALANIGSFGTLKKQERLF